MNIRPASLSDADGIAQVYLKSRREHQGTP